jgi:hypothetical protein
MHRTGTVDYTLVPEGEVVMLLEDEDVHLKAADVVIQDEGDGTPPTHP